MRSMLTSLCAVLMLAISATHAQRPQDFTRIPEPISVEELRRYGDILGLSDDQRFAAEAAYDQYLDEFDPLRREMIEAAVNQPASTRNAEQFTGVLPGFLARTEAMDEAFFARIDPILIEAQREHLPRVRDLRVRTLRCNIDALGRFIGDSLPELRELLEELSPPPEVLGPLVPALAEHERKATIGIREIFDATMGLCGSLQPEDFDKDRLIDGVKSLRAMNRKLVDDITPSLPADIARRWRGEFLARAYGYAAEASRVWAMARIDAALASEISDDERVSLEGLRARAQALQTDALATALELHDQDAIRRAGPGGAVDTTGYLDKMNALRGEVGKGSAEISKAVSTLLGADRVKALKPANDTFSRSMGGLRYACGVTVNVGRIYRPEESRGVPMSRSDPLIPAPLTVADGELIAAAMHLDAKQRAAVIERVQAAAAALEESTKAQREQLARQRMVRLPSGTTPEEILAEAQAGDATRVAIRDAVRQAEIALLDEIRGANGIASDDPAWQGIVRLRERASITLDLALRSSRDPNCAGDIDLMRPLLAAGLDAQAWSAVETLASTYESNLLGLLTPLHDAMGKYMVIDAAQRGGWRANEGYEVMSERNESLHKQVQALAALNQESIAGFVAALPAEPAATILDEFNRAAYPVAFADRASAMPILERAAALPSLTGEQRERIGQARAEFETTGHEVCQAIVDICAAVKPDLPMVGKTITPERAVQEERFELEYDRLNDERAQINRRALRSLRLILTPEQMSAVLPTQAP